MRLLALSISLAALIVSPALAAEALSVPIGQAVKVALARSAEKVAVGSDKVIDVTVIDSRTLLITGKAYGLTNLLAFDARGGTLLNQQVNVAPPATGGMTVYSGTEKIAWSCTPRCSRSDAAAEPASPGPVLATPAP